jgi:phosphate transport system substrate-binding protein
VRVDGSNGVLPLVAALAEAYQREHPATVIVIGKGMGSGARLAALREGRIDIALASHGLDTAALVREGFTPHRVATTAVVIGVNAGAPARAISATQLCAVFTGGPPAWRTVTGREEPVAMSVVARAESEVDMEVLRRGVACLTSAPMAPHVAIVADTDAMQRALLASPGAIGITTATVVRQGGARLRALALDGVEPTPEAVASGRYPPGARFVPRGRGRPVRGDRALPGLGAFACRHSGPDGQRGRRGSLGRRGAPRRPAAIHRSPTRLSDRWAPARRAADGPPVRASRGPAGR